MPLSETRSKSKISEQAKISVKSSLFIIAVMDAHPLLTREKLHNWSVKPILLYTLGLIQVKSLLALTGWVGKAHSLPNAVTTVHFHTMSVTNPLFLGMFCTYADRRTFSKMSTVVLSCARLSPALCDYLTQWLCQFYPGWNIWTLFSSFLCGKTTFYTTYRNTGNFYCKNTIYLSHLHLSNLGVIYPGLLLNTCVLLSILVDGSAATWGSSRNMSKYWRRSYLA